MHTYTACKPSSLAHAVRRLARAHACARTHTRTHTHARTWHARCARFALCPHTGVESGREAACQLDATGMRVHVCILPCQSEQSVSQYNEDSDEDSDDNKPLRLQRTRCGDDDERAEPIPANVKPVKGYESVRLPTRPMFWAMFLRARIRKSKG
jgi:hypothetical protein